MAWIGLKDVIVGGPRSADGFGLVIDDLAWEAGTFGVIAGPAGAGKSLLLALLAGGARADRGRVTTEGLDGGRRSSGAVGWHDARAIVYETLTVRDNLLLPLRRPVGARRAAGPNAAGTSGVDRAPDGDADAVRVDAVLAALGLAPLATRRAGGLGPADRWRVSIGRLLVRRELAAVLLDEPFAGFDVPAAQAVAGDLARAQSVTGSTVIVATRSAQMLLTAIDDLVLLEGGRVVARASPAALYDDPPSLAAALAIGDPPINRLAVDFREDRLRLGERPVSEPLPDRLEPWLHAQQASRPQARIVLAIRPEHLAVVPVGSVDSIAADLTGVVDRGLRIDATLALGSARLLARMPADAAALDWVGRHRSAGAAPIPVGVRLFTPQCRFFLDGVRL